MNDAYAPAKIKMHFRMHLKCKWYLNTCFLDESTHYRYLRFGCYSQ